jgi:glycosyltransferase involved in cell wall biosynthesis
VRVGLVATMGRFKGHDVFLRAIARLPRDLPLRAYVVSGRLYQTLGSQFDPARLRELAGELGIGDRVGFTGFVPHPAEAMRALDVVVHASTRPEPFGLVIAEAMACARPVVVSWAGGPREIVTPGSDGLPHTPGSDAELADAILRLARDAPLRERMGRAGRAAAEARFGRARLGAEMAPVYRALAAGP